METNKILKADILDILFDGKNKDYGAYDLRKTYNTRMMKSLFATGILLLFVFVGSVVANKLHTPTLNPIVNDIETKLVEIKNEDVIPPKPIEPIVPPKTIEVNQIKHSIPVILKDNLVNPEDRIEEITDDAVISSQTIKTDNIDHFVKEPITDIGTTVTDGPIIKEDPNKVFVAVEVEAAFPGGQVEWTKYLRKNLNPNTATDNAAPEGTYKVIVRFIVGKDGTVSDVVAETKFGYGMEEEAVKVIKRGPKWIPALQNGMNVNAYRRQPITFLVASE